MALKLIAALKSVQILRVLSAPRATPTWTVLSFRWNTTELDLIKTHLCALWEKNHNTLAQMDNIKFSNYFLSFLNPNKLFFFEISLFYWSVAPGKIGKNIFPGWKKNCSTWKNIFHSWKNYFFHVSHTKRQEKLKMVFCYHNCSNVLWEKIVLVWGKKLRKKFANSRP